jgi:hypothetical protein
MSIFNNFSDIFNEDFDSKYTLKVKTSAPADTVSLSLKSYPSNFI